MNPPSAMKGAMLPILFLAATSSLFAMPDRIKYPPTRKSDVVEDHFGSLVHEPFRWLEDTDSPETRVWIEAQNKLTFGYLGSVRERKTVKARITQLWNYERFGIPVLEGGKYFYMRNTGLQNQSVLFVADSLEAEPRELLDPNEFSKDGTIALASWSPSPDGKYLAYAMQSGGSDWMEWKVRDVETGKDLTDHVKWSKFSGASWAADSGGFFYSRYDEPKPGEELSGVNFYQKLYYHKLGAPQAEDVLVYERPDQKEWGFAGIATEDGRYLVIQVWRGTERKSAVFYKRLDVDDSEVVELLPNFDAEYSYVANDGPIMYFQTNLDAPLSKLIAIDTDNQAPQNWKTIIPESIYNLEEVSSVGGKFFARYLRDAHSVVRIYSRTGESEGTIRLPGLGTAAGFGGRDRNKETFYAFTSFTTPNTIFRYDIEGAASTVFRRPKVDFEATKYQTRQVFATSKDGTKIPMFITFKRGIVLDGRNLTLLTGYGGFAISLTPWFSVANLVWMEMGGVFCVANLRGGGEYGEEWHQAGMKEKKQTVFDDFIACAEWLIANKYTSPSRLVIEGGSNGGLLIGAVLNQRPDLFGAALPSVGVMDMLRFHKFTIGWAWTSEYGSPDNEEDFQTLFAYSPLHNIQPGGRYPAVLVTTGDHDDRVVPGHSFKYAAAMQSAQAGEAPILIRIETRGGHGGGKPTWMIIDEYTDRYAFVLKALNFKLPPTFGK